MIRKLYRPLSFFLTVIMMVSLTGLFPLLTPSAKPAMAMPRLPDTSLQAEDAELSYSHNSDLLQITVGEQSSAGWNYQYDPVGDPGNFIRSVYLERYYVGTDTWGSRYRGKRWARPDSVSEPAGNP
ncbi:hypothetical protein ACFLWY_05485 [Chloroflexota bacterium]